MVNIHTKKNLESQGNNTTEDWIFKRSGNQKYHTEACK